LAGFALGVVSKDRIMLRRGAKPGDVLAVTGELGLAAVGHQKIKGGSKDRGMMAVEALLRPRPLVQEGMVLSSSGKVTSCMDLSDSLASSVHQMSKMSDLGFEVEFEKLPISREVGSQGMDPKEAALYFGGDYQLLLTLKNEDFADSRKALNEIGTELTVIGKATESTENTLRLDDESERLENRTYEHFG
jgi:thiamine-monophosphate kinase